MLLAKLIRFLIKEAGQKLYFEYALKPLASFLNDYRLPKIERFVFELFFHKIPFKKGNHKKRRINKKSFE